MNTLYINTSIHQHINTSTRQYINTSTFALIDYGAISIPAVTVHHPLLLFYRFINLLFRFRYFFFSLIDAFFEALYAFT